MDAPGPFFVRIFVHVIRKDDGTGGITDEQVQEGIDFLHDAYDEHEIFFIWDCNIDNIPSSTWYYANSPLSGFFQSTPFNNHFNTSGINIYIFPDRPYPYATFEGLAKSSPGKACLVMGNYPLAPYQAFSRSHILSHEVGHCLGLLHTHHHTGDGGFPTPGEAYRATGFELADDDPGSNCDIAGDCVCDTPADPNLVESIPHPTCTWLGTATDIDGNPITSVAEDNIMSYTNASCMKKLTEGQGKRARNILATQEILQSCLVQNLITNSQSWNISNTPSGVVSTDVDIIVEPGVTLTIESGITVKFSPNTRLIIKPNALVVLEGTLTNNPCGEGSCPGQCGDTWKGVEVWGNSDEHQYYDYSNAVHYQGRLRAREGSLIENAEVGVQLWGPSIQTNTGGVLIAFKSNFKNNLIGVDIAPYEGIYPITGSQANYFARFTQCDFITDTDYPHENNSFTFLNMSGVKGVSIRGSSFINTRSNPPGLNDIVDFGYGIKSNSASFTLETYCAQPIFPCPSNIVNQFEGLGYGISIGKLTGFASLSEFANIAGCNFSKCFVGVDNRSFNNVTVAENNFTLGILSNNTLDVPQMGVVASNGVVNMSVEENIFTQSAPNANLRTVGINCFGLGAANNIVRNNTLDGLTIGNEAGGNNGGIQGGLLYQCNTNLNISEYDFLICDQEFTGGGTINPQQKAVANQGGGDIASGNKFANTGIQTYRDFSNETAANEISYFHKLNGGILEIPDEYIGLDILIPSNPNPCPSNYCPPPCDTENNIIALKGDFYTHRNNKNAAQAAYQTAQTNGDTTLAAEKYTEMLSHRQLMDLVSQRILLYMKMDTLDYSLDSVRNWLSLSDNLAAELEIANDYFSRGNFSMVSNILSNAPVKFNLTSAELTDLTDIQHLFNQLQNKYVFDLSTSDIHFLEVLAQKKQGFAGALARNILSLYGYHYPPETEACTSGTGGEPETRSSKTDESSNLLKVYPNPANQTMTFEWMGEAAQLQVFDITGRVIHQRIINQNYQWNTSSIPEGIYLYHLKHEKSLIQSGRIIIQH